MTGVSGGGTFVQDEIPKTTTIFPNATNHVVIPCYCRVGGKKMNNQDEGKMPEVDRVYFTALIIRNKLVYYLDWLLMRIHTWRTGIKHKGADPRIYHEPK